MSYEDDFRSFLFDLQYDPQDYTDDGEMQSVAKPPYTNFRIDPPKRLFECVKIRLHKKRERAFAALKAENKRKGDSLAIAVERLEKISARDSLGWCSVDRDTLGKIALTALAKIREKLEVSDD
jgi:hypothetical protein